MKYLIMVLALSYCGLVVTNSVWAQEFLPYEGKNAVREGDGGTKKIVDSIEFWVDGAPPKQFKLLGYITDRRHKTGLIGKISMSSLDTDIAKVAKANGGDAVILVSSGAETIGAVGNAVGSAHTFGSTTTGGITGWSRPVQKNNSKYAVVKYTSKESLVGESKPTTEKPESTPALAKPDTSQLDANK